MTELLYLIDSYLKEFRAEVIEVIPAENAVVLNRTAFYPAGGGQPSDQGRIQSDKISSKVIKVNKRDGKILHYLEGDLPAFGTEIIGRIDWQRRYELMRTHTALHALSAVVWRDFQAQVTGGNLQPLQGRLDFELAELNAEITAEIEKKVNLEIRKGLAVTSQILPRLEAEKIPDLIRTKINLLPPGLTEIRVVKIAELDLQADGGTHVKNTAEIGKIKIIGHQSKGRINKRIKIEVE